MVVGKVLVELTRGAVAMRQLVTAVETIVTDDDTELDDTTGNDGRLVCGESTDAEATRCLSERDTIKVAVVVQTVVAADVAADE